MHSIGIYCNESCQHITSVTRLARPLLSPRAFTPFSIRNALRTIVCLAVVVPCGPESHVPDSGLGCGPVFCLGAAHYAAKLCAGPHCRVLWHRGKHHRPAGAERTTGARGQTQTAWRNVGVFALQEPESGFSRWRASGLGIEWQPEIFVGRPGRAEDPVCERRGPNRKGGDSVTAPSSSTAF